MTTQEGAYELKTVFIAALPQVPVEVTGRSDETRDGL